MLPFALSIASDSNALTGSIPSEIGLLTGLKLLDLSKNSFEGEIPSEIGLLTNLISINFDQNEIEGIIPSEIGLLTTVNWLNWSESLRALYIMLVALYLKTQYSSRFFVCSHRFQPAHTDDSNRNRQLEKSCGAAFMYVQRFIPICLPNSCSTFSCAHICS